jgi:hypothetical protein
MNELGVYRAKPAAALVNPTSASTFVRADDSTKACALYIPQLFEKTAKFRVVAAGRITVAGTYAWLPALYYGTSATAASNTSIAAATSRNITATTNPWEITAEFLWEATVKTLFGKFTALNGWASSVIALDAWAVTTVVTSVDLTVPTPPGSLATSPGFTVAGTVGTGGTAYLDQFFLEVL